MPQLSNFSEVNRYLSRFYRNTRTRYTLDNMRALMEYLGNPQDNFKAVHVAGTSGKTSTAYYMSALLTSAGAKTGLTVSPHVDSLNERLQINGQPLPEEDFCRAMSDFLDAIEEAPVKPSWFELMVGFAYWYFAREQVDYAVIEVGLGGLRDGTNVITRADKVCIITDIGFDHMNVLGRTLAEIATQKIGIVQDHNAVFTYEQSGEIMEVYKKRCADKRADLRVVPVHREPAENPLPTYQYRNWHLAFEAYHHILKRDNLTNLTSKALANTQASVIPGRMDIRHIGGKTLIMDGAHNAQKMETFLDSFCKRYPAVKPAVLISLKAGKEYREIVPLIAPAAGRVIVTGFEARQDTPAHSMDPAELAAAFQKAGKSAEVIAKPPEAYRELIASPQQILVVTGSFYLLSQIRNNENLA